MSVLRCSHCRLDLTGTPDEEHNDEHPGLCCECLDLSCGMPLEDINEERFLQGRPPIARPWPEGAPPPEPSDG
jgi:hypothetical protein